MACRAASCGLHGVLETEFAQHVLPGLPAVRWMGVDVSSQVMGVVALRLSDKLELAVEHSVCVPLPKSKPGESRSGVLLRRSQVVHDALKDAKRLTTPGPHCVCIEDRLVTVGRSSGVIGKQTLVELNTIALLLCKMVFEVEPQLVHPKSARKGLGINHSAGESQSREEVKAKVVSMASTLSGKENWRPSNDEADAFFVGAYGLRLHCAHALAQRPAVQQHFDACHPRPEKRNKKGVVLHRAQLELKCRTWADSLFTDRVWVKLKV